MRLEREKDSTGGGGSWKRMDSLETSRRRGGDRERERKRGGLIDTSGSYLEQSWKITDRKSDRKSKTT